ncbi:MAG: FixH family protein [Terriglobales bacterium]
MSTEVAPQPARVGPVTLNLKLSDSSEKPVSGAHIALEGDMSHPGMAPVFGEAKEIEAGRYQGSLQLNMSGDWVMLVHIELTNGMKLERQINLNGVQAN